MLDTWKPISRPQERFLALPDTIKEGFFGGSAGPGKSEILMMYPIVREWFRHPKFKALFTRRTYKQLKLEILPRARQIYSAFGGKFNQSDMCWSFEQEGGGLVFFGHIEHEKDVHNYDSMEINLYLPDELQQQTEYSYLYIGFERVRTSYPELPAIIRGAGMPGDIGHSWTFKRFIKPNPKGGVKIVNAKSGNKRIFIFSTLKDNPRIDPEYAQSLEEMPEAEKKAKKYGDYNAYQGQVFGEFREIHYPTEPENAIHVIDNFDIPDWWPCICVIDWGFEAWNYVTYTAISPSKRIYLYREQACKRTKIEMWGPLVKEFIDRENVKKVIVCKSAGQDRGVDHTVQSQIEEALGCSVQLSNNKPGSRVATKLLLHEYLRWELKPVPKIELPIFDMELSQWILRNYGDSGYADYMKKFKEPEPEINIPKLQIFKASPEGIPITMLQEAIKACNYPKSPDGIPAEDVMEFDGDDPYDNIRYVVDSVERYFEEAEQEMKDLEKREALAKQFEINQDWNQLYMQARAMEQINKAESSFAIRRYRRH